MANELLMPNALDMYNKGTAIGQQNRFNQLAGEAYAAPEEQRNALLTQAVGIDPGAGMKLQDTLQERDDGTLRRAVGAARYVKQAYESKNPQMLQGAYQSVRPFLAKLGAAQGKVPPEQWSDDMLPQLHQLLAMGEGATNKGGDPTGYREFDMIAKAAGLSPGTPEYQQAAQVNLGTRGRAATGGFGFKEITGADGRTRWARQNPRTGAMEVYDETTGDFTPLGGAGALNSGSAPASGQPAAAPMQVGRESSGMPVVFDNPGNVPPQVLAAVQANPDGWGAVPDGTTASIGPQQPTARPQANPGLGVSRTPEEQAARTTAAQEQAKINAEIGAYRQMTGLETERAGAVEGAKVNAKAGAERADAQRSKADALRVYEAGVKGLSTGLASTSLTGPIAGRLPAMTTGQQVAQGGVAAMAPILKQIFRSAGEGTFTDSDQKLLMDMLPTRTDTPQAAASKMANIDAIVRAKLGAGPTQPQNAPAQGAPAPGSVQDGYRFRGGNPADPNAWERI